MNTINIDDLTLGQIKQLRAMLGSTEPARAVAPPHPMIGKYVLVRCYSAGVHTGVLTSLDGDTATLQESRRLWAWHAQQGIALSGVAQYGINASKSKLDSTNPEIALTGVIEVIPMSASAEESVRGAK